MELIVLTGLVLVEKINLTIDLARHFQQAGRTVTVLDNVSRLPIAWDRFEPVVRLDDLQRDLQPALAQVASEVALLAVSETVPPDDLLLLLDDLPEVNVQIIALIDTRTCDCFPQLRVILEDHADVVIHLPVEFAEVVEQL
jgi:hypothetical protein